MSWLPPQQVAVPFKGDLSPSTSNTEVTYGGEPAGQAVHLGSSSPFPSLPCASVSSLTPFFFAFHSIFFLLAFLQVSLVSASHLLSPPAALLSHFLSLTTASVNLHNLLPSTVAWTGWGKKGKPETGTTEMSSWERSWLNLAGPETLMIGRHCQVTTERHQTGALAAT